MQRSSPNRKRRPEQAQFWQDPDLPGIEILDAHYFTHSFARHSHSGFVISIIEDGAGAFWYKGCVCSSPAGYLGLLNPDEPHTGQVLSEMGWKYRALYIAPEILPKVAHDTGFVDQSHLTRRFKQIVGCTPGQVLKYQCHPQECTRPGV